MWHLVGVGSRIALELGLHSAIAYAHKTSHDLPRNLEPDSGLVKQEVARLCFWSIVAMDRFVQLSRCEQLQLTMASESSATYSVDRSLYAVKI
jgi:hypothetical protein